MCVCLGVKRILTGRLCLPCLLPPRCRHRRNTKLRRTLTPSPKHETNHKKNIDTPAAAGLTHLLSRTHRTEPGRDLSLSLSRFDHHHHPPASPSPSSIVASLSLSLTRISRHTQLPNPPLFSSFVDRTPRPCFSSPTHPRSPRLVPIPPPDRVSCRTHPTQRPPLARSSDPRSARRPATSDYRYRPATKAQRPTTSDLDSHGARCDPAKARYLHCSIVVDGKRCVCGCQCLV